MTGTGALLAALAGALVTGGAWLAVAGWRRVPAGPARHGDSRPGPRSGALARRDVLVPLGAGLVLGLVVAATTGWVIAVPLIPAAAVVLPPLLLPRPQHRIEVLEGLEEWTRGLAGVLTAGVGLEQALVVTLRSTPAAIRPQVSALVGRLHARWPTEDALRAFADDLDDATGDLVAAKLVLAARRRGPGLASVLESLAESVAADVRARRQVEADRDKPRATVRWVALITLGALVLLGFNGPYIAPYSSPLGQVVLGLVLTGDLACLVWMRVMTRAVALPRFIGSVARRGAQAGPGRAETVVAVGSGP